MIFIFEILFVLKNEYWFGNKNIYNNKRLIKFGSEISFSFFICKSLKSVILFIV